MNISTFCNIWNDKVHKNDAFTFIQYTQSQLSEENITNRIIFTIPDQVLKRGFLSKKKLLGYLTVADYSPLPDCLAISKEPITGTLYCFKIWLNMLWYLCQS